MTTRAPLLVPTAAAWAVALVAVAFPEAAGGIAAGAAVSVAGSVIALLRWPRVWLAVATICALLAGCAALTVALTASERAAVAAFATGGAGAGGGGGAGGDGGGGAAGGGAGSGRAVEIDGVVRTKIEPAEAGAVRFEIDTHVVSAGERRLEESVPLAVWADADVVASLADASDSAEDAVLDLGSRVRVRGMARQTDRGERAVLIVFATRIVVEEAPGGALRVTSELRRAFVQRASVLPGDGGGLVPGLAVGDTSAVSAEVSQQMRTSSLSHLTAVSGANCAVVVALVFAVAGLLRLPRMARVVLSLGALGCFVMLVTPEPSVLRAAAMTTVALVALATDRTRSGLAVLALAVAILIVVDPWLSHSLGFALSAAATAGLLILSAPLASAFGRLVPTPLAVALAVPAAAQLACGPLLVLIDPRIPAYGIVANLLAGPAAPVATLAGLASCLVGVIPPLADVLAWIAWVPASWIAGTARVLAGLPGADVPWPGGVVGAVGLAAVSVGLVFALVTRGLRPLTRRARAGVVLVLVAGVGCAVGAALLDRPLAPLTVPAAWSVAQCDIGQGDAVALRSGGAVALIDTGPDPAPLDACLARLGIGHIDLLVLTHFDLDHVGGLRAVTGRVTTVLHGRVGEAADQRMLDGLVQAGARTVEGSAGMNGVLGAARWSVLWPVSGRSPFEPGNDLSLVLDVARGQDGMPRGLYLGDLSAAAQRALRATGRMRGPYDIVKVAHHGSADQDPALYAGADAALALIGVGAENDYGHPRTETLDLLRVDGAEVLRSDEDGIGLVRRTDEGLAVWRERAD